MAPALCGELITSRRSFLALAWTLTTLLSFFSFGVSVFLASRINLQYNSLTSDDYADWYKNEYGENWNKNGNNCRYLEGEGEEDRGEKEGEEGDRDREGCSGHSNDYMEFDEDFFASLATTNSRSLEFAGVYSTVLGIALSLYGSTVVVGFMSLKGEYIPPCFNFRSMSIQEEEEPGTSDSTTGPKKLWGEMIHRGIFLGCLVVFSNLLLLCAVIFGELKVHDNYKNYYQQQDYIFSYRIERIASVFAITCAVLAIGYILFAIIYLSCGGISLDIDETEASGGWLKQFEMRRRRHTVHHHHGARSSNAIDKSEPLVGAGIPPGGITDSEGFITEFSTSSGSSTGSSRRWENDRARRYAGTLS